nr:hypothetical protein [uncultured Dysosmobacter sp.]
MRETKTHGLSHRLTAALLCLCMVASMLSGFQVRQAYAAAGQTEHIVENSRVADPDTMDDYLNRLLTASTGSRYAGRVWTDKSVFAYSEGNNTITLDMDTDGYKGNVEFNADFAHVFSALASSQVVNEYPPSPIDMVLVLDVSSSMGDETEPADNVFADIRKELVDYFSSGAGAGILTTSGFDTYYNSEHYVKYKVYDAYQGSSTYHTNSRDFVPSEFEDSDLFGTGDDHVSTDGKFTSKDVVEKFLAKYHAGMYMTRASGSDPWTVTDTEPEGWAEDSNHRRITGVEISAHGHFWSSDGNDLTMEEAAAQQAFSHTRFLNLIYSANRVIEQLMNNNPENRVSVVIYDRRATVIMPLAHYDANTETLADMKSPDGIDDSSYVFDNDKYTDDAAQIIYKHLGSQTFGYLCPFFDAHSDSGHHPTDYVNVDVARVVAKPRDVLAADGVTPVKTIDIENIRITGTDTHAGLTAGMEQLANAKDTTLTAKLSDGSTNTVPRIPALIVMTDGGSNTVANGPWYDPDYATPVQRSDYKNEWSTVVVTQYLLTAAYLKSAVEKNYDKYMALSDHQDLPVYTVGVDLRDDSDDWVPARLYPMMDPANYFKRQDEVPGTVKNPTAGDLPLGDDSGTDKRSNEGIIGNAYENWTEWADDPDADVTTKFPIAHWSSSENRTKSRFSQQEDSGTTNIYLIPFEQDEVNHEGTALKQGTMTYDNGAKNSGSLDVYYNQLWHGWEGETTSGLPSESLSLWDNNKDNNAAPYQFDPDYDDDALGTATFWSFNDAKGTVGEGGKPYKAGGNSYQADYLADRTVKYNDGSVENKVRGVAAVTQEDMKSNINYVTKFYDVSSAEMEGIFEQILAEVMGQVFVPISGDNDAGVGNSITYQDPLGEYMEIKNQSIIATPHHIDNHATGEGTPTTYDMALLVFGEMHGLVRAGVYDWNWNDQWMRLNNKNFGVDAFPQGWYKGEPKAGQTALPADQLKTDTDGSSSYPACDYFDNPSKTYSSAQEARDDGWVMRFNFQTLLSFVPITGVTNPNVHPSTLPDQVKNTVYTCYRFAGSQEDRNELHRNPIYGDGVPTDVQTAWDAAHKALGTSYPTTNDIYAGTPGVYRLSDIRVWVEEYGDFNDTDGAITPNSGYDRSLYVDIPAAAVPTELATITLGENGVMAYETNLGSDHDYDPKYCYQSTPFRLFYAVGLEEDLILRDDAGNQTGVDFNKISPEYISSHGVEENNENHNYVWFISNYYSETRYDEYATDSISRTRGDPTVTFSPGSDNRYYVFQKPLPLYAHAYRASGSGLTPVDNPGGAWTSANNRGGNGTTTWENSETGGASWTGGQYMGTYASQAEFQRLYNDAKDGKITDSNGGVYELVENGIVFLQEDLLEHVTSNSTGSGYTDDSISFSSNDYFFILLEFYVPTGGVGQDRDGVEIEGSQQGKFVQWALARKGSEFGSGYASSGISNGDMLCWTDMNGQIGTPFAYMSMSDTDDRTRGEPTFEKLTYGEAQLREYLRHPSRQDDAQPGLR